MVYKHNFNKQMDMVATISTVGGILSGVATLIIIPLITYIFKREVKRIDNIENGSKEIKENYMDRFDKVNDKLDAIHTLVTELHTEHKYIIHNNHKLKE